MEKKEQTLKKLKKILQKLADSDVNVNIKEIKKPELNSNLVAENIAQQLVKRIAYRRAMKRAMQSAMRLNARGIKVMLSGRLAGNEIARTEWLREGSIPSHTLRADIDYGVAEALTTYGIIGVKVWIYKGEILTRSDALGVNHESEPVVEEVERPARKTRVKKKQAESKKSSAKSTEEKKLGNEKGPSSEEKPKTKKVRRVASKKLVDGGPKDTNNEVKVAKKKVVEKRETDK